MKRNIAVVPGSGSQPHDSADWMLEEAGAFQERQSRSRLQSAIDDVGSPLRPGRDRHGRPSPVKPGKGWRLKGTSRWGIWGSPS
jgi:hypothetical protein